MAVTDPATFAWHNLSKRGNKTTQKLHIFVIDLDLLVDAEETMLLSRFLGSHNHLKRNIFDLDFIVRVETRIIRA